MEAVRIIFFFILGIEIGSFLHVVIDRLPAGQSLVRPPSHCSACGTHLKARDLIPVFSYLWLRGHCRYCGTPIPPRILWIELVTGGAFAGIYAYYGLTTQFGLLAAYTCLFLVIFVIDLDHQLILNKLTYPGAIFALATVPLWDDLSFPEALIGGAVGFALLFLVVVLSRGGMGWGDVKMAALMGLVLGYPLIFVGLFVGIVIGGIVAITLLATGKKGRKQVIPFGPFLAIGAMTALLWGHILWDWYIHPGA